jgi:hypothetical protein
VGVQDFAAPFQGQNVARTASSDADASLNEDLGKFSERTGAEMATEEPETALAASADSCTVLVSLADPIKGNTSLMNVLFKSVEVEGFTLSVDYTPIVVRTDPQHR